MYLRDKLGSYEIIVDKERRVVHEKLCGLFTCNDSSRLEKEFIESVIPYLGKGNWVKLCDMREYILNTSVGHIDISYFIQRIIPYGFIGGAVLVSSEKVKNYLSLAIRELDTFTFRYFTCEEEADEYLKSLGF